MEWSSRGEEMEGDTIKEYVVDTSVMVKWFSESDETDLEKALKLRDDFVNNQCLIIIPDLLLYELANALRYQGKLTQDDVRESINSLIYMELEIRSFDINFLYSALKLAFEYNVTIYDAYFLALAEAAKSHLITADYRFFNQIKEFKWVKMLKSY